MSFSGNQFGFGGGGGSQDGYVQKNFPGIYLSPTETSGEYQEWREISGGKWTTINAAYNTTLALAPTAAGAWNQVLTSAPSYAIYESATGSIARYCAAATGGTGLTPITFTLVSLTPSVPSGAYNMGYSFQRNKIINGGMTIDQRNSGASVTVPITALQYTVDRWAVGATQASKFSVQQQTSSAFTGGPPSQSSLALTSLSAYAPTSSDYFYLQQRIEASNVAEFAFSTAAAKPVTLSFYAYSTTTSGTYSGSLSNGAGTRSYPFTFTLVAGTWTLVSINIPGDTGGTWTTSGTGSGMAVSFNLGCGSTYLGTAGAWASANYVGAPGTTSLVATNAGTLYFTCVQIESGNQATPFEQRLYGTELALCQRYFELIGLQVSQSITANVYAASNSATAYIPLKVTKRATPTVTFPSPGSGRYVSTLGVTGGQTFQAGAINVDGFSMSTTATFAQSYGWFDVPGTSPIQVSAEL